MTLKRSLIAYVGLTAASSMMIVGCAGEGTGDETDPLKVGVIVPLSGEAGPNGEHVLNGIEAQAALINAEGGVDGREIEILSRDDQSEPATGVSAATDLIEEEVDVVMGGWNSPVTLAIQPILVRDGVLNITSIPQNASILGEADETAIRMNAGNAVGGYVAAHYMTEALGAESIATMLQNDAYGLDAGEFMESYLPDDVSIDRQELFEFSETDFRVPISNIMDSGVEALYSANAAESTGQPALMQQLEAANLDIPYFAGTGTVSDTVVEAAGDDSIDTISVDLYFADVEPWSSNPKNQAFIEQFTEDTGNPPDKFAALGAQSMDVWAQAVEEAGSADRQAVADVIQGGSFSETILGEVQFTEEGQQQFSMFAFEVNDGEVEVLDEIPIPEEIWEE